MGGFHVAKAHEALDAPESDYKIEAAIAIGRPTDAGVLPESYRAREIPSGRRAGRKLRIQGPPGRVGGPAAAQDSGRVAR